MEEKNEAIDNIIPAKGDDVEQLLEFIENESQFDEFLRDKRDLERNIMFYKNRILEMTNTIIEETELMHKYIEDLQTVYKKYIDNGCPKEDNIY
jgi:hypothetical protein